MKKLALVIILLTSLFISNLFAKDLSTTPYKRLNKFFNDGGIPKNIELNGWFSGRCFAPDREWQGDPSLLVFSSCGEFDEPLFSDGERKMMQIIEPYHMGSNYFDEMDDEEIEEALWMLKSGAPYTSEMREEDNSVVSYFDYPGNSLSSTGRLREKGGQLLLKIIHYSKLEHTEKNIYYCAYRKRVKCN